MLAKPYENQLRELGFSEKEVRVYLAALELGSSSVQKISQKADIKRATTYVMIESLMERGLMSSYEKGKKMEYTAEPPERFSRVLDLELATVTRKQGKLQEILPDLMALYSGRADKPKIAFFEGIEGFRAIQEDILATADKSLENIVSVDDNLKILPFDQVEYFRKKLLEKKIQVRALYTSKEKLELPADIVKAWPLKRIPHEKFPIHGEITLYGDKMASFSYRGKIFGTIIENKEIVQTIRTLFELAWSSAEVG